MKTATFWVEIEGIRLTTVQCSIMERKKNGLIGFLKRAFGIGYEVVEAKLHHTNNHWPSGQNVYMEP